MMENSSSNSSAIPEELAESLSALVDAEQNDFDLQRVLKSLDTEAQEDASLRQAQLRQTWSRYHLAGALMRKEAIADITMDLSQSISAAIAAEDAHSGASSKSASRQLHPRGTWWSGIGKTAVAASVTLGVVFAAQQFTSPSQNDADGAPAVFAASPDGEANNLSGAVVPQGFELPPLSAQTVSAGSFSPQQLVPRPSPSQGTVVISSDEFKAQMDRLMYKHAEQVSSAGALGVIPFARLSDGRGMQKANSAEDASKALNEAGIDNQVEQGEVARDAR